eukprot:SAG11_NODE_3405_length_2466_cov_2.931559_2_plen_128_part_00
MRVNMRAMRLFATRYHNSLMPLDINRSGRRPEAGESSWRGVMAHMVPCQAADCLLFRSDVWHSGGRNKTVDGHRYLCEVSDSFAAANMRALRYEPSLLAREAVICCYTADCIRSSKNRAEVLAVYVV